MEINVNVNTSIHHRDYGPMAREQDEKKIETD